PRKRGGAAGSDAPLLLASGVVRTSGIARAGSRRAGPAARDPVHAPAEVEASGHRRRSLHRAGALPGPDEVPPAGRSRTDRASAGGAVRADRPAPGAGRDREGPRRSSAETGGRGSRRDHPGSAPARGLPRGGGEGQPGKRKTGGGGEARADRRGTPGRRGTARERPSGGAEGAGRIAQAWYDPDPRLPGHGDPRRGRGLPDRRREPNAGARGPGDSPGTG